MKSDAFLSTGSSPVPASDDRIADYRVMVRLSDGGVALVSLARTLAEAVSVARQFRDAAQLNGPGAGVTGGGRRHRILAVFTEGWFGGTLAGRWKPVLPPRGFLHRFEQRGERGGSARPHSGQLVACVLLAEKTRKGGWRAQLVGGSACGPITNSSAVPAAAEPGQCVELRIGAIAEDGRRVQFDWPAASSNGSG